MPEPSKAVCARCGHRAGGCPRCGRSDAFLGGYIDGQRYCHTFAAQPSCYTLRARENLDAALAFPRTQAGEGVKRG